MKIGDELNDGIIFHIDEDGKSGLIAMKKIYQMNILMMML